MNLLSLLVDKKLLDRSALASVEEEMKTAGLPLETVLAKHGVDPDLLLEAKGEYLKVPIRRLRDEQVPAEVLNYIPEESAQHYRLVPLAVKDGVLEVGLTDPDNLEALDALNFISGKIGMPYKVFLISDADFEVVANMYKGLSGEVNRALSDLETELSAEVADQEVAEIVQSARDTKGAKVIKEDAPVTKMVATILRHAVEDGASDIHVEHTGGTVRVRFRIDGVLQARLILPAKVHRAIVARIKILSSMRLDEKRKPQDGRFSATVIGRPIDVRVSTFPAYFGEKVVMRILDREKGIKKLEETGLTDRNLELIRTALRTRPYGIILISGPTGSGKTTTLYAMLNEVDRETRNVLSLEDPVEYNIESVSQSQVRPEIGYTFATGLRTTLRQDPDVIMVGEIRDKETAQLAIQAALTGHIVLSTIHTNNAVGVIPRLIDMGVDPYLIPPTLILAIAQRLVRTLCPGTGKAVPVDGSIKVMIDQQFSDLPEKFKKFIPKGKDVYEAEPSEECPSGIRGRTGVFEVLAMDKDLEQVILKGAVESELARVVRAQGMLTMKEDAIIKSMNKLVPFQEVNTLGGALLADEEAV